MSTAYVTPLVARIAAELDVDPNTVTGTGAGGRITPADVRAAASAPAARTSSTGQDDGTGWFPGVGTPVIPA